MLPAGMQRNVSPTPAHLSHGSFLQDAAVLCALASILLLINLLTGNGYGFHRDELQFLDDARHLHWGFVAYPPLTSFCGRVAIALFGISPQVFRLPAALTNAASLVLTGLLARELGGRRPAQILALAACFPVALAFSSVLQYNTFDLFAWILVVFFTARVLRTGNARNWLGAGVGVGLGILSKYSIAILLVSLLAGLLLLPSQRHHLRSRWFWIGALLATAIAAPNLLWLARHHFVTLHMESHIHARDVRLGRADGYFTDQIKFTLLGLPLAIAGLIALLRATRCRLLGILYLGPLFLFAIAKGRGYYLLPAYPVLYAAGAVALEQALQRYTPNLRSALRALVLTAMLADAAAIAWAYLPLWPVHSRAWTWQMTHNADMANEVGWPELVAQVAAVRDILPAQDRARLAILGNNFGEAGALALYGPQYGLPTPISTVNSFHDRGFGTYIPETYIILGSSLREEHNFQSCTVAAHVHLPNGVRNEETDHHPEILICRHLLKPLPELWARSQTFG